MESFKSRDTMFSKHFFLVYFVRDIFFFQLNQSIRYIKGRLLSSLNYVYS